MGPLLVINYRNEKKEFMRKNSSRNKNSDKENQSNYMIESIHEDITYVKLGFAL
jgi:hypothetical protein